MLENKIGTQKSSILYMYTGVGLHRAPLTFYCEGEWSCSAGMGLGEFDLAKWIPGI